MNVADATIWAGRFWSKYCWGGLQCFACRFFHVQCGSQKPFGASVGRGWSCVAALFFADWRVSSVFLVNSFFLVADVILVPSIKPFPQVRRLCQRFRLLVQVSCSLLFFLAAFSGNVVKHIFMTLESLFSASHSEQRFLVVENHFCNSKALSYLVLTRRCCFFTQTPPLVLTLSTRIGGHQSFAFESAVSRRSHPRSSPLTIAKNRCCGFRRCGGVSLTAASQLACCLSRGAPTSEKHVALCESCED